MKSINPYNEELLKDHAPDSDAIVLEKLEMAQRCFESSRSMSILARIDLLAQLKDVFKARRDELARCITIEMGKVLPESYAEVDKCIWLCSYYERNAEDFLKPVYPAIGNKNMSVHIKPIGPVLGIMPWNFPLWQVMRFAIPALLVGNTVLLKHASNVQLCASLLEAAFQEAGYQDHSFTNLCIPSNKVEPVLRSGHVSAVSLTGSEQAGKSIATIAGSVLKKCVLELGGNDPYLILDDADLELAASKTLESRILNAGQSCIGAKRIIVHKKVYADFTAKLIEKVDGLHYGNPLEEGTSFGPLCKAENRAELDEQIQESIRVGAVCLKGGVMPHAKGFFYPPTMLEKIPANARAAREELFGPVLSLFEAASEKEMIGMANATRFGLGASVFTRDKEKGERIACNFLEAGSVALNDFVRSDPRMPFGGIKDSGYGRELGREGLLEFSNIKSFVSS